MFETILAIGGAIISAGVVSGIARGVSRHLRPKIKGHAGESAVHRKLRRLSREDGVCLRDLLLPGRGTTSQIDNILINRFGIFVIEVKNYSGKIVGGESEHEWKQLFPGRKKHVRTFLNPIEQNKKHVDALRALLKKHPNLRYHSIVAFSDNCELEKSIPNVVHFSNLKAAIRVYCKGVPPLSADEVQQIANEIQSYNIPGREARKDHALRASLSAQADKNDDKEGVARLKAQARYAPRLVIEKNPEPTQDIPKERAMLTDEGAMVRIKGKTDSIEHFFERAKRDSHGLPVPEKGAFTHFICPYTNKTFPVSEARPFYRGLWVTYLKQNPELVSYLENLGPDRIRCASARTETVLRSYIRDSAAFQAEIRQSAWYQNMAQQQKNKKGPTQRQALDKIMTDHPPQLKSVPERKPSLDNQISKADKSKQPSQNHKAHTHDDLTH